MHKSVCAADIRIFGRIWKVTAQLKWNYCNDWEFIIMDAFANIKRINHMLHNVMYNKANWRFESMLWGKQLRKATDLQFIPHVTGNKKEIDLHSRFVSRQMEVHINRHGELLVTVFKWSHWTKLKMKNLVVLCMVVLLCTSMVAGKLNFIFAVCLENNSFNYFKKPSLTAMVPTL